jgi:CheY-like chemotaxis protein
MARILIVEDNPDNMKLFRALLTLRGHEVTALPSGEGLFDTLSQTKRELILLDVQLPGKDGFELLADIRNSDWAKLRVVGQRAAMCDREETRAQNSTLHHQAYRDRGFPKRVGGLASRRIDSLESRRPSATPDQSVQAAVACRTSTRRKRRQPRSWQRATRGWRLVMLLVGRSAPCSTAAVAYWPVQPRRPDPRWWLPPRSGWPRSASASG